eukprot:7574704-Alexandrium_andersonii.AAC.1
MSASLVGSEMCIRDSDDGVRRGRLRREGGSRGAVHVEGGAGPPSTCTACLLYTSDAADDM